MEHVTILLQVITLLAGSVSIVLLAILYRRRPRRYVLLYAIFVATINLGALMQMVITYSSINISQAAVVNDFPKLRLVLVGLSYLNGNVLPLSVIHQFFFFFQASMLIALMIMLLAFSIRVQDVAARRVLTIFGFSYLSTYLLLILSALFPLTKNNASFSIVLAASNTIPLYLYKKLKALQPEEDMSHSSKGSIVEMLSFFNIKPREKEVIELLVMGKTNKEIEETLFISNHTVKNHIYHIFQKLDVKSRGQLASLVHNKAVELTRGE